MRLVARSGHARLKHKEGAGKDYMGTVEQLYYTLKNRVDIQSSASEVEKKLSRGELVVLVGSQKGLCGTFNVEIFKLFDNYLRDHQHVYCAAVGRRATDHVHENVPAPMVRASVVGFGTTTIMSAVAQLMPVIRSSLVRHENVTVISNISKTFFVQKPSITCMLPPAPSADEHADRAHFAPDIFANYLWEQPIQSIIEDLTVLYLEAKVYSLLFQSLLAEQASRFLSMDSSTHNADGLLEVSKIEYNKLRQAKITKEVNELASVDLVD